jgi:hypothetical protein
MNCTMTSLPPRFLFRFNFVVSSSKNFVCLFVEWEIVSQKNRPVDCNSFERVTVNGAFFHFRVVNAIETGTYTSETKSTLYSLLKEALFEGQNVCSTGKIERMINVLSGFDSNVQIKISENSQISAIISVFKSRNEPKEKVEKELESRGVEKEEIDSWLAYY